MPVRGTGCKENLTLTSPICSCYVRCDPGHLFKFSQDGPPHAIHSAIQQA
jgi:hypothetical protein